MDKQMIISISREFGSGGHAIAEELSKRFGVKMYDRSLLDELANQLDVKVDVLAQYDEKPRNPLFSRRVREFSNSMEEVVAELQFNFLKEKAASGESFVVVGRCSEKVLEKYEGLVTIFVSGKEDLKVKRVMERYNLSEKDALEKMRRHDKNRKKYHNRHVDHKWGDSRYYELCINSHMGIEKTANILEQYIKYRFEQA